MYKLNYDAIFLISIMGLAAGFIIWLFLYGHADYIKNKNIYEKQVKDCEALSPRYGMDYTAKSGPYLNVPMKAITFTPTKVGLLPNDLQGTPIEFMCAEIVESNPPLMEF